MDPLILTVALTAAVQQVFDRLREQHFPPERNHIGAHVTLFHHLPGDQRPAIEAALAAVVDRPGIDLDVTGVRMLGRGVAFQLRAEELLDLRAGLARRWAAWLGPQDRAKNDLHVTVQNKVSPAQARALHADLTATFQPHRVRATGLSLWRYDNGPWEHLADHLFTTA